MENSPFGILTILILSPELKCKDLYNKKKIEKAAAQNSQQDDELLSTACMYKQMNFVL